MTVLGKRVISSYACRRPVQFLWLSLTRLPFSLELCVRSAARQMCSDRSTHLLRAEATDAHDSLSHTAVNLHTMNRDHESYPYPQAFLVDGAGGGPQHSSALQPNLVPCWTFPPAQERERARGRGKSRGCMGVGPGVALVALMLFMLAFVSLGFEAYQIHNMQKELKEMRQVQPVTEFNTPQKQIAHEPEVTREPEKDRPAAHVIGRIETEKFPKTLRWESKVGRAFVSGAVHYRPEDGALQLNQSGLYHVYSRVELIFRDCSPSSSFVHSVFVRRAGRSSPLTLMEAHRAGFCSQQQQQQRGGGHAWTTESYLASALKLQKSDRVFVNVSHPLYLSHSYYANFFGLYQI